MGRLTDAGRVLSAAIPGAGRRYIGSQSNRGTVAFRLPDERSYRQLVNDGSGTSLITAAVNWMAREIIPARRVLLRTESEDAVPRIVRRHDFLELLHSPTRDALRAPNGFYSGTQMLQAEALSWMIDGNVYRWKIRSITDRVVQRWYLPHWCVEPIGENGRFIDHYRYSVDGQHYKLDVRDIDHLRFGLDPLNPRKGLSPIRGVLRDVATDELAARFSASLLHNVGFPGAVIIPGKDVVVDADGRKDIKERFAERFGADGVGETIVLSANAEVKFLSWNPKELDLSSFRDLAEERVSANIGIPAAVLGFGTGLQQVKVGATMRELRAMGWEGALIPFLEAVAENETQQTLPEFDADAGAGTLEVGWDLSRVKALSEIRLKEAEIESTFVRARIKKVDEARAALGLPPVGGKDGGFQASPGVGDKPAGTRPAGGEDDDDEEDDEDEGGEQAAADEREALRPVTAPSAHVSEGSGAVPPQPSVELSSRELQVAGLVTRGMTNKEIATRLGTSERTVERQVSAVFRKTGASSRNGIAAWMAGGKPVHLPPDPLLVYFIGSEQGGPIKIGLSASPEERLQTLQTASPHRLKLLAQMPGSPESEEALHERFAHLRLQGEWFRPAADLREFISSLGS